MNNDNFLTDKPSYLDTADTNPLDVGFNVTVSPEEEDKSVRLNKAKLTKVNALSNLNNNANLDDSFTRFDDGRVESNANKIWNDLSDHEIQSLHAFVESEKQLIKNPDGTVIDKYGIPFMGKTEWNYAYKTKVNDSDVVKIGKARGDRPSSDDRYVEYPSGELGVDINKKLRDQLYPSDVATMLEAVDHGRKKALENRVVKDRYSDPFTADDLGGGSSEYYNSLEGVYGKPTEVDLQLGERLFNEMMGKLPKNQDNLIGDVDNLPISKPNSVINALSGAGAAFVNELLVKPIDAIGDLTGLYDLDTNGDTQKAVERAFGYDSRAAAEAGKNAQKFWDIAANDKNSTADRMRAALNGTLEAFTTPEVLGTSMGTLAAWITPTWALKLLGYGGKLAKSYKAIDTLVDAGKINKLQGRVLKAKKLMSYKGMKDVLVNQAGFISSALGNVNKQYEQFVENNNGKELTGKDKAEFFAGRLALQVFNQNIDKLMDVNVIKSPGTVKALAPAIKTLGEKEFKNVAKIMGKGIAKSIEKSGMEASQEYVQTMMELYNSRSGSEKFKNLDTFVKFITSTDNIREAGASALMGFGGSPQFEVAGSLSSIPGIVVKTANKLRKSDKKGADITSEESFTPSVNESYTPSEEAVKADTENNEKFVTNLVAKYSNLSNDDELHTIIASDEKADTNIDTPKFKESLKETTENYDESLLDLEDAIAFIKSKKEKDSVTEKDISRLKFLNHTKRTMLSNYMGSNGSLSLGSGYSPEDVIKEFLGTVEVKDDKFDLTKEEEISLVKFAKNNNIPKLRFEDIKNSMIGEKDAATVQEEALGSGDRSVNTYKDRLHKIVFSSNPDKKSLAKVLGSIDNFLHTQEARKEAFDSVLQEVKGDVYNYNKNIKSKKISESTRKRLLSEIINKGNNIPGYDTEFINIGIDKDTGLLSINKNSLAVSDSIGDNIKYLNRLKSRYAKKISLIIGDSYLAGQSQTIYVKPNNKHDSSRKADTAYYEKHGVTKVIVDNTSSSPVWNSNGDYRKYNIDKVNSGEYTKDDVVVINSTAKSHDKNKELAREINKAYKAGATIIIDRQIAKEVANNSPLHKLLNRYHMKKVKIDGVTKYVREDIANKIKEQQKEAAKADRRNKAIITKALKVLELKESGEFNKISDEDKNDAEEVLSKALDLFGNDEDKLKAHHKTRIKNQINEQYDLLADAFKYGEDSPEFSAAFTDFENMQTKGQLLSTVYESVKQKISEHKKDIEDKNLKAEETVNLLRDWKEASSDKEENLSKWIKDNVSTAKEKIKTLLKTSIGVGKEPVYVYEKGKDFSTPKKSLEALKKEMPEGSRYQVIELDPNSYVEVGEATPLNSLDIELIRANNELSGFNEMIETSVDLLNSAVKPPETKYFSGDSIIDISNSSAYSFIYKNNEDGNVIPDENVAVALNLALSNYIRNSGYLLEKGGKTKKDIAEILGIRESEVSTKVFNAMRQKGMLYKTATNSIGKDIANLLGLKRKTNSDADSQSYDSLLADLGQIALLMGVASGILEIDNKMKATSFASSVLGKHLSEQEKKNNADVLFINTVEGKEEQIKEIKELSTDAEDILPNSNTDRVLPHYRPLSDKQKNKATSKIRKEKLGLEIADTAKEAMDELMDTEWEADLDAIKEVLDHEEAIKKQLGYIEIDEENPDYKKLSFSDKEVQESVNRRLDNSFDELRILLKANEGKHKVSMWFKYFFSKNGRFFIDSNTIQPQTDKHLHRFLVQPKKHKMHYEVKGKGKNNKFLVDGKDVTNRVYYALAQSFGYSTDKKDTKKNYKFGYKILATLNTKNKIEQAKLFFIYGKDAKKVSKFTYDDYLKLDIDLEHFGQALQAFSFLEGSLYQRFDSSLTAEFDAVTSGFGIKNQQLPILNNGNSYREKTGFIEANSPLITEHESKDYEKSMNDILDSGNLLDNYQTLGSKIENVSFKELLENVEKDDDYGVSNLANTEYNKKLWESLSAILPKKSVEGIVSGELRSLFKHPFMTFNYASSIHNIRNNLLIPSIIESIASDIAAIDLSNEDMSDKDRGILALMESIVGNNGDVKELQEEVRSKRLSQIKISKISLEQILSEMIDASYGIQVENILTSEFGAYVEAQEKINNAFRVMFEAFFAEYEVKLSEARKEGAVSVAKEKEIYESLKDIFPAIKAPLTQMEDDLSSGAIGVYSTESDSVHGIHAGRKPTRVNVTPEISKKLNGNKSIRTSAIVRKLSAAIAAGSVVPIHYIDGAIMASMLLHSKNQGVRGIATIHDAIMPPLDKWDIAQRSYNENALKVNASYSIVHEINVQLSRILDHINNSNSGVFTKKKILINLKSKDKKTDTIENIIKNVSKDFNNFAEFVNDRREKMYNSYKKNGVYIAHMAGTPDGVFVLNKGEDTGFVNTSSSKTNAKTPKKTIDSKAINLKCN